MMRHRSKTTGLILTSALLALFTLGAAAPATAGAESKAEKNKPVLDGRWAHQVSAKNKKWARRVAECESGTNPNALGGGGRYRGAFQFLRSTWQTTPQSPGGDPVAFSFKTQAYVAVRLRMRSGSSPWPNCG